jgi:D-glycero-alpha-D-manno-heptose-7-phosphate kinase
MITSRTPLRISFSGGGSDFKEYYRKYGGCVISTSINKYVYLSMHPYFYPDEYLIKYSETENVKSIDCIKHRIIKEVFLKYDIRGVDFNSNADIPSGGTGLGSSSAFTASLITLCAAYKGLYVTKEQAAEMACEIEIDTLGEPIGKQDQYACAIGGVNYISFNPDDTVSIEKITLNNETINKLQNRLIMFFTGITRPAKSILTTQRDNILTDTNKIRTLHQMVNLTVNLKHDLQNGNIDNFGKMLDTGWRLKKNMASGISNDQIDSIYELATRNGAEGGKILGAGGGGFLLFYVREENRNKLIAAMNTYRQFDFKFENIGSTIIYCN